MELLVVVSIIALLAAVVVSSLNDAKLKTRDTARMAHGKELQKAIENYFSNVGSYPKPLGTTFYTASQLSTVLVPTYIKSLSYPQGYEPSYITNSTANTFVIILSFENRAACEIGPWDWNSSIPSC